MERTLKPPEETGREPGTFQNAGPGIWIRLKMTLFSRAEGQWGREQTREINLYYIPAHDGHCSTDYVPDSSDPIASASQSARCEPL